LQPYKFKTIITLVPEDIPLDYQAFMRTDGIKHHQIHILANKNPDLCTEDKIVNSVIKLMLDPENHPILIHCNKGKHRTGCITACFRKVTGWSLEACLDEYERYSRPKSRDLDKEFVARYDETVLKQLALDRGFICEAFSEPYGGSSKDSEYTNYSYMSDDSFLTELHVADRRDSLSIHPDRDTEAGYLTDDSRHANDRDHQVEL